VPENLIDPMSPFIVRRTPERGARRTRRRTPAKEVPRLRAKEYMEGFINPPDYIEEQKRRIESERDKPRRNPREPERDVLLFLLQNAPLDTWERGHPGDRPRRGLLLRAPAARPR
jgi:stage V sporulation protein R